MFLSGSGMDRGRDSHIEEMFVEAFMDEYTF